MSAQGGVKHILEHILGHILEHILEHVRRPCEKNSKDEGIIDLVIDT
jgi:hypothetical protein